ncbi:IclR family transcriptional regulator [Salinisphaera hydrothermalis]|uniref:HTH-type transcriptional repressor AllR n=1 Tax=Salinisphaera hydrothermalis (strain C41B8) TaxID=1304275 RepID=A0A084IPY7_SALHC|nr:IclR family transcriptional regulator [Salinisphaera hydrothermalis]KEZ78771.1 transcriptional regulator IclR [Salinisphaera hydrothermalis C41B8]
MTISVERAFGLLRIVCEADRPPRFSDIVNASGLPKSTVNRLLATLGTQGLVRFDSQDKCYRPGFGLLSLAAGTWAGLDIRRAATDEMAALLSELGETVHLAVLEGDEVIYLDKLESPQSIRLFSAVGKRGPVYCTGIGKAILAELPEAERDAIITGLKPIRYTPSTLTSPDTLRTELEAIRERGCAYDMEEHEEGIRCVAVAIRNFRGEPIAGISVTSTASRLAGTRMVDEIQPRVIAAGRRISEALGHLPSTH